MVKSAGQGNHSSPSPLTIEAKITESEVAVRWNTYLKSFSCFLYFSLIFFQVSEKQFEIKDRTHSIYIFFCLGVRGGAKNWSVYLTFIIPAPFKIRSAFSSKDEKQHLIVKAGDILCNRLFIDLFLKLNHLGQQVIDWHKAIGNIT